MNKIIMVSIVFLSLLYGGHTYADTGKRIPPDTNYVIVFDYGGVMADFNKTKLYDFLAKSFTLSIDDLKNKLEKVDNFKKNLAEGNLPERQLWNQVAEKNNLSLPDNFKERFIKAVQDNISPRANMYGFIRSLKEKGFKVVLLSNISEWQKESVNKLGLYDDFDELFFSCELKAAKPDRKIYNIVANKLNKQPHEIVFIDDRIENIKAANSFGMHAILYDNFQQVRSKIDAIISQKLSTKRPKIN